MMKRSRSGERGSALLLSTVVALVIMGITGAYMAVSMINTKQTSNSMFAIQALFAAEAGASAYIAAMNESIHNTTVTAPIAATFPNSYNGATYSIVDSPGVPAAGFRKLVVTGTFANVSRSVEVILSGSPGGVYWDAIFAGNSSGTPYTLNLTGGVNPLTGGAVNDMVQGDIYSGGNVNATSGALLTGDLGSGTSNVMYAGTNSSTATNTVATQGAQTPLDLQKNSSGQTIWEQTAQSLRTGTRQDANGTTYIDVAYDMATMGQKGSWVDGSSAVQIAKLDQPSHIFRQDPTSDYSSAPRTQVYEFTPSAKHDYYMEDPTNTQVNGQSMQHAVNGDTSASAVNIAPNGNNAVYFIDGNMRVSGEPIKSYQLNPVGGTGDLKMTIVVKGNVSLTDNILYPTWQSQKDSLAIIAVKDPAYPNVAPEDFLQPSSALLTQPSGLTIAQWTAQFNSTALNAQSTGHNIPILDLTSVDGRIRAAAEYNKAYGSGNVYFGDPGSGTVEHFESYMYAENNFYGTNLDSTNASGGTQKEEVWGNMTAGNHVDILRNTTGVDKNGNPIGYLPLHVFFDPAIKMGQGPPALPSSPGYGTSDWIVASWRQVP
jgi:hypothetical protein